MTTPREFYSELKILKRMLMSESKGYAIWYHCKEPPGVQRDDETPLSGGYSGAELVRDALRELSSCTPQVRNTSVDKADALKDNLYLLDAPIQRVKKTEVPHNPVLKEIWDELHTSIRFKPLTDKLRDDYPRESLGIFYGDHKTRRPFVAGALYDYGVIIRAPNPRNGNAIVLILAGLHAPATHAAAKAVTSPEEVARLFEQDALKHKTREVFFESVFRVKRTYWPDDLGPLEWVYVATLADQGGTGGGTGDAGSGVQKRSTESGEAKRKLISALTEHHDYQNGSCLNPNAIGNNELAKKADVSGSTASKFLADHFKPREGETPHAAYRRVCNDIHTLIAILARLNDDFPD